MSYDDFFDHRDEDAIKRRTEDMGDAVQHLKSALRLIHNWQRRENSIAATHIETAMLWLEKK